MENNSKIKILFLCTGNACRSQMAEGWARFLKDDQLEPYSAGIEKHGLNPCAVQVMREAGVDIADRQSKTVEELQELGESGPIPFDVVVTVCGHADQHCPAFLSTSAGAARVVHVPFDDPPQLAAETTCEEETLAPYRRVRDEIRAFVESLPDSLGTGRAQSSESSDKSQKF